MNLQELNSKTRTKTWYRVWMIVTACHKGVKKVKALWNLAKSQFKSQKVRHSLDVMVSSPKLLDLEKRKA